MITRARARSLFQTLFNNRDPWTGPVERRAPESYQKRSEILTWRCVNRFCGQWTMNGSYRTGRCNFCQTPRPTG